MYIYVYIYIYIKYNIRMYIYIYTCNYIFIQFNHAQALYDNAQKRNPGLEDLLIKYVP